MTLMTDPSDGRPDARDISQSILDRTGQALMTGDLGLYLSCYILPHRVHTFEVRRVIHDRADLTQIFHDVRGIYASLGVTALHRRCTQATYVGPARVNAHYESRALNGTQFVYRPFPALTELHLVDGDWRVGDCQYAIADAPRLVSALLGPR